jgi:hypothetical protein
MHSKNCTNCGADNDPIFTNCIFCKTALPVIDLNSLSNEELIMNAGEWIGKLKEGFYTVTTANANMWLGRGISNINKAQIQGFALKYLTLIQIRTLSNNNLLNIYNDLKNEYNIGVSSDDAITKKRKLGIRLLIGMAIFFIIYALVLSFIFKK